MPSNDEEVDEAVKVAQMAILKKIADLAPRPAEDMHIKNLADAYASLSGQTAGQRVVVAGHL